MSHGITKLVLPVAVSLLCGTASAASITLVPSDTSVRVGDTITVKIDMDFSDIYGINNGTVGGGVDVTFDNTKVSYVSHISGSTGDSSFRRFPDPAVTDGNKIIGIAAGGLGEVDSDLSDGDQSSPALGATDTIVTLTFTADAIGDAAFSVAENATPAGGFWSFQNVAIEPTVNGSSVNIAEAVSPCNGDFDGDGDIDSRDSRQFKRDFGRTDCLTGSTTCNGDFDNDGDVDSRDSRQFKRDFGRTDCPI